MARIIIPQNKGIVEDEFKPKHIEIDEKLREKLNKILRISKSSATSKVIKTWLMKGNEKKDLY
jgi:hypothetical protein